MDILSRANGFWKLLLIIGFIGFVLSVLGFFLPWVRWSRWMEERQLVGWALPTIALPIIGCLAVFLSLLVLIDQPSIATPLLMAFGSFVIIFGVTQWIYNPFPYEAREGEILYGTFITLTGATISIMNSILSAFYVRATKAKLQ